MGGDYQEAGLVFAQHLFRIGVDRDAPAFSEEPPPLFTDVAACGQAEPGVGGYGPGVGAGLLPSGVVLKEAGNPAQPYDGRRVLFHADNFTPPGGKWQEGGRGYPAARSSSISFMVSTFCVTSINNRVALPRGMLIKIVFLKSYSTASCFVFSKTFMISIILQIT
jgi:hypothetical protein